MGTKLTLVTDTFSMETWRKLIRAPHIQTCLENGTLYGEYNFNYSFNGSLERFARVDMKRCVYVIRSISLTEKEDGAVQIDLDVDWLRSAGTDDQWIFTKAVIQAIDTYQSGRYKIVPRVLYSRLNTSPGGDGRLITFDICVDKKKGSATHTG